MIRVATDEDFDGRILAGVRERVPSLDVVRVQDSPVAGSADPVVLAWCASEGRVLLTHDHETMIGYAWARVKARLPMPGLIPVKKNASQRQIIDDIFLVLTVCAGDELADSVLHLPL